MKYVIGERTFLDAVGMSEVSGLSRSAVLRLARLGRVPYYQLGRRWLFNPEEFMEALRCGPPLRRRGGSVSPPEDDGSGDVN
jgi:excisionase family DNA binding protein